MIYTSLNKLLRFVETVRFYFWLHGFKGGVLFAVNLIRSDVECIYYSDLQRLSPDLLNYRNPNLKTVIIKTLDGFRNILDDYRKIRGKHLALSDSELLRTGRNWFVGIYQGGVFVGWGWIKIGPLIYGNCQLGPKDCLIHKCRTLPQHRGKRVYTTALIDIQFKMAEMGFLKAVIGAKSFNKNSLKGIEKAGFVLWERYSGGSFCFRLLNHITGRGSKILKDVETPQ